MNERTLFIAFIWVAIAGVFFSLLCLILSGAGDHPDAFRTYLLCSSIVLGASILALALCRRRDE